MSGLTSDFGRELGFIEKLRGISWGLVVLVLVAASCGIAVLFSAADGNMQPWASAQMIRFAIALVPMLGAAFLGIRSWFRVAYWVYALALALVVAVDLRGFVGMGARRWIDLGLIQLQPSSLMNIALVLALARYFHVRTEEEVARIRFLVPPALMVLIPAALVLKQPDLGTAIMLLLTGAALFFIAGVRLRFFALMGFAVAAAAPTGWHFLRDYQKNRIYTFLDPESDPLGAGYHILQSKIALGSGGFFGRGFLNGTQSHLSFLPEKQTDFIFTTLAEEFGFVGGVALLALYMLIVGYGFVIALRCRSFFGRLLGLGIVTNFSLYVFINTAMVMGLIPVVGVPLPLISYGGTAMLAVMFGFGLVLNVGVHREVRFNRKGELQPD
ncbi:MAG: rod shape-determining protein RodA [Alphaproteobacteria bacterium]|nr:rod shape-determining protein RodA [Alphaproteobacteria bacterium]